MRLLQWLATFTLPFFIGFLLITVFVSPFYPNWAYSRPNFPDDLEFLRLDRVGELADRYNIGIEQVRWDNPTRNQLAQVAVDYLMRWDSAENTIFMLEDQTIPFSDASLYNPDEIKHMVDVKRLTNAIRWLAILFGVATVGTLVVISRRQNGVTEFWRTVWRGGLTGVLILTVIGGLIGLAWDFFFVQFHELLFPPGTWTFLYTDSLIRLFPEKFWFDFGVWVSGSVFINCAILAAIGYVMLRQSERSG